MDERYTIFYNKDLVFSNYFSPRANDNNELWKRDLWFFLNQVSKVNENFAQAFYIWKLLSDVWYGPWVLLKVPLVASTCTLVTYFIANSIYIVLFMLASFLVWLSSRKTSFYSDCFYMTILYFIATVEKAAYNAECFGPSCSAKNGKSWSIFVQSI